VVSVSDIFREVDNIFDSQSNSYRSRLQPGSHFSNMMLESEVTQELSVLGGEEMSKADSLLSAIY